MRRHIATAILVMAAIAPAAPAAAQEVSPLPIRPSTSVLEALCEANSPDDATRTTCLDIVHTVLAPTAERAEHALGTTHTGNGKATTVLEVDWSAELPSLRTPAPGNKYISVLVRYEAVEDMAHYNPLTWKVFDADGFEYGASPHSEVEPGLNSGDLRLGQRLQGWVTFEVPQAFQWLEVHDAGYGQDDLWWEIGS